jgi:hypothetical protein
MPMTGMNGIMPQPREVEIDLKDPVKTMAVLEAMFPKPKKLWDMQYVSLKENTKLKELYSALTNPDLTDTDITKILLRGNSAVEKPRTVLKLMPHMDSDETLDEILAKAAARQGYIDGITKYAADAKLHVVFGDVAGVNLKNEYHLASFVAGMMMQAPSVWMPSLMDEFNHRPIPADQNAYKAGILIALAKKGVDLVVGDGPFNKETYDAFQSGRYAKPAKTEKGETAVSVADVAEMKSDFEMHYCLGLDLWIVEQGLKGKVTHQDIRHPEALYAFKTVVGGAKIGDYDDTEPSAARVARKLGQAAYDRAQSLVPKKQEPATEPFRYEITIPQPN